MPEAVNYQREQMQQFLAAVSRHLEKLGVQPLNESDEQLDRFFRAWRKLPERQASEAVYDGFFPAPPPLRSEWSPEPPSETIQARLTNEDYRVVAQDLGIEVAALRAIVEVESNGNAFFPSGRIAILFESHLFYYWLQRHGIDPVPYTRSHPNICTRAWTRNYYGGEREYDRLQQAMAIHEDSALMSFSAGLGQVLTLHWLKLGYASVHEYLNLLSLGVNTHLDAIGRYLKVFGLLPAIRARDWHSVARMYNGESYAVHGYHTKLQQAYHRWLPIK